MPTRPQSGKHGHDSFMSDANANDNPIAGDQIEEVKRVRAHQRSEDMSDSFHTSDGSSGFSKEDVSEETH